MKFLIKSDLEFAIDNLGYIQAVMSQGLISKKGNQDMYCGVTSFKDGTICVCDITKSGTHIFDIRKNEERN